MPVMDLSTTYLGFKLPHPFMPGASPLVDSMDMVRRLEDAGASAIVMHSLFEEQIQNEYHDTWKAVENPANSFAEAVSLVLEPKEFTLGPDQYLKQVQKIKAAVSVPVIASLNGTTSEGWLEYARRIEQAGADALELNVYYLAADPLESSSEVDARLIRIVQGVRQKVKIPVAVKLSFFCSGLAHLAHELDVMGVNGLVLFNRFYQPDIDVENLEVVPTLKLSDSSELQIRLRWLAILSSQIRAALAVSGGVHTYNDAVKAIMCGASAVQVVSALLRHGPERLAELKEGLSTWLEDHQYESLEQLRGSMNHDRCPDPGAFERANYMRVLQGWRL
jgi:dihydroorotate dehydrogenase (fumarate)